MTDVFNGQGHFDPYQRRITASRVYHRYGYVSFVKLKCVTLSTKMSYNAAAIWSCHETI